MDKVLITGITGSGASYLAEYLLENVPTVEVHGLSRWHSTSSMKNIDHLKDRLTLHECDLTDFSATFSTLKKIEPDYIFHLAAHANVKVCFSNPLAVLNNNMNNTVNLFEVIKLLGIDPVVQFCGTSEVYGLVDKKDTPITEEHPLNPVNIYAVSKLCQEKVAMSYFYCYGIKVVVTRMFAYINPKRGDIFSTAFARQVASIEAGKQDVLTHGNLDSIRNLIDVRDAMRSYWIASQGCSYGEPYNIGGTTVLSVGDFLDILKKQSTKEIISEVDPELLRPSDVTLQICDSSKFIERTGWKPKYSLEESIKFLLDSCRRSS
jgi:GDP-4-dehydro-6-deoxy-D-mannose reductase